MAMRNLSADWRNHYKEHLVSIEEAANKIVPGDVVWLGQPAMVPYAMLDVMYAKMNDYHDVTFLWNVMNVPTDMLFDHDVKKHFRLISFFDLPLERISGDQHVMEYHSCGYDQIEKSIFLYGCNSSATRVCPPDEDGWCNVGCYGVSTNACTNPDPRIEKKIGFIDSTGQYPVPGPNEQNCIHITEFDYIVESDSEMMEIPAPEPSPIDKKIASYILPYIHNADKIQIGYGGLGEEILKNLADAEGSFEVFSEVACDSMLPLLESGKITKIFASSPGACTEKFFKFISVNPNVTLIPKSICIEPLAVMEQENIVAINATFMVDLLGQACSEAQGLKPYTGAGGSFAYLYGATRAKGGRSFLCLRSTYVDGCGETKSNIVPWLPEGSIVTTPKNYVMYVVSEWGLADIYLRTMRDRIKALIKIAHPDFRQWLMDKILTTPIVEGEDFEGYDMFDNL